MDIDDNDFLDLWMFLNAHEVRYTLVGGFAPLTSTAINALRAMSISIWMILWKTGGYCEQPVKNIAAKIFKVLKPFSLYPGG